MSNHERARGADPKRAPAGVTLATVIGLCLLTSCTGYDQWLREATATQPHLAGRVEAPHRVAALESGRDALLYRIECIRAARRSIQIQTFILDDTPTTRLVMHELVLAARRGVRVQILTDSLFSAKDAATAASLAAAHPALELRIYNPNGDALLTDTLTNIGVAIAEFGRLNQRMHNKLMVFDGRVGICGGRNFQDSYYDEDHRLDYRDRDVAVEGPVVAEMQTSFETYWSHFASIPIGQLRDVARELEGLPEPRRGWPFSPDYLGIDELATRIDRWIDQGMATLRWHDVDAVAFWADTAGKPSIDDDGEGVAMRLIGAVGNARDEVLIQSPYLVFTDAALVLLEQVRERGVAITVSTNSLASTDNWSSYAHAMRQREEMLQHLDLEVFELMPYPDHMTSVVPDYAQLKRRAAEATEGRSTKPSRAPLLSLHAKSMVIDEELAVIGSYNLDPRSETLNSEVLLAVWDDAFAREIATAIRRDTAPGNSWVVAMRRHSLPRALVGDLLRRVNVLLKTATTIDLWSVELCSLYELRDGCEPVSRFDEDFYRRYRDVGSFPGVRTPLTRILVLLTKALTGFARPLM